MSLFAPRAHALARQIAAAGFLSLGFIASSQAVTFTELGDAGAAIGSAQATTGGAGALTDIFGSLSSGMDVDLFLITIANPAAFSATTVGGSLLDTQIFLLTAAGAPVLLNDDFGNSFQSTLPVGSFTLAAGQYIIGVAETGNSPVNSANQTLFDTPTAIPGVYGPTAALQPARLGGYTGTPSFDESGAYDLKLTGATIAAVPEPSTYALMLLGVGALGFAAQRRRSA